MSGYPVILNGDHAEFEREHANTPPHERPDWPLPSFDATDWAAAFCKIAKSHGLDIDEAWMVTWFANALMRGFDEREAEVAKLLAALKLFTDAVKYNRLYMGFEEAYRVALEIVGDIEGHTP